MNRRGAPSGTFVLTSEGDMGDAVGILVVESLTDPENTVSLYRAYQDRESGAMTLGDVLVLPLHALDELSSLLLRTKGAYEKRLMKEWLES